METFPTVKRKHSTYRTKRVFLEIYDAIAEARHTLVAHATRLNLPSAGAGLAQHGR